MPKNEEEIQIEEDQFLRRALTVLIARGPTRIIVWRSSKLWVSKPGVLFCDLMTSRGTLMAITRHGINVLTPVY